MSKSFSRQHFAVSLPYQMALDSANQDKVPSLDASRIMDKPSKPAERIGSVPLNSGVASNGQSYGGATRAGKFIPHQSAELVRECDPGGAIVVHAVRKSAYVHERLHSTGKLAHELYDAAEKFRSDFERAQLSGNYARLDMFKTRSGRTEMSDNVATAKIRINKALDALGNGKDGASYSQSCVWSVVGSGLTLDSWTSLIRQAGGGMNADKASGILHGSLERLALHYGMIDVGRLASIRQDGAYGRAIRDCMEFANVFAAGASPSGKDVVRKFIDAAQKRFSKHL